MPLSVSLGSFSQGCATSFFFFFNLNNFIYSFYFLTVLGLHCCVGFSLVATSKGYSLTEVCGFLSTVSSLSEHRL